jgi:hypothetical protein
MFKRVLSTIVIISIVAVKAGAYEPDGFNGKLYAAEVAVGGLFSSISIGIGSLYYVAGSSVTGEIGEENERKGLYIVSSYPIAMGLGTFLAGEIWGAPSENILASYFIPTATSLGVMGISAYLGSLFTEDPTDGAIIGEWIGTVPNAFLTAYLYNVVKKPKNETYAISTRRERGSPGERWVEYSYNKTER